MMRRFPIDMFGRAPWPWLRHFVSWRMLGWLSERYHLCWAEMVGWKLGDDDREWHITKGCLGIGEGYPYDYCGKYDQCTQAERDEALDIVWEQPEIWITFK